MEDKGKEKNEGEKHIGNLGNKGQSQSQIAEHVRVGEVSYVREGYMTLDRKNADEINEPIVEMNLKGV